MRRGMFCEQGVIIEFVGEEMCIFGSGGVRVLNPEKHAAEVAHTFLPSTAHWLCELALRSKEMDRKSRDEAQRCAF